MLMREFANDIGGADDTNGTSHSVTVSLSPFIYIESRTSACTASHRVMLIFPSQASIVCGIIR